MRNIKAVTAMPLRRSKNQVSDESLQTDQAFLVEFANSLRDRADLRNRRTAFVNCADAT